MEHFQDNSQVLGVIETYWSLTRKPPLPWGLLHYGSEVIPAQVFPSEDALSGPTPGGSPCSNIIHQLPHLSHPLLNTG